MQDAEVYEQLRGIYCTILKREDVALTPHTVAADIEGWDSLTHMILMDKIEERFSFKFKLMEVMKFKNVGDMVVCIQKKLAAK